VVLVTGGGIGRHGERIGSGSALLLKAGLPDGAVVALPAGASTSALARRRRPWFSGKDNRRVLLVSDGFHMLRLRIIATGWTPAVHVAGPQFPDPVESAAQRRLLLRRRVQSPGHLGSSTAGMPMQLESRRVYTGRVVRVDVDTVRFPDGSTGIWRSSATRAPRHRAVRLPTHRGSRSYDPLDPPVPVTRGRSVVGDARRHARPGRKIPRRAPTASCSKRRGSRRPHAAVDLDLDHAGFHR